MMKQATMNGLDGFLLPHKQRASQGKRANQSGRTLEDLIWNVLIEQGCTVIRQYAIGAGLYGHPIKVDFFVTGIGRYANGLIVESKWQETPGSVDEKFPYLVENIRQHYPCPTIVVCGGSGSKLGAIEWLRRQIDEKLIGVFSIDEFLRWAIRNL